jgi:ribonuclease HI
MDCKKSAAPDGAGARRAANPAPRTRPRAAAGGSQEENLTCAQVLAKYSAGPQTGVFTDGAANPNPGPGGWGAVFVREGQIVDEKCCHEPATTNNRMELVALINGFQLVPKGEKQIVYTDSQLCVNTITVWAKGWERAGWKRKGGEIKNLELIKQLYALQKERPELTLQWIAAHSGNRWNEYADALATAYRRSER